MSMGVCMASASAVDMRMLVSMNRAMGLLMVMSRGVGMTSAIGMNMLMLMVVMVRPVMGMVMAMVVAVMRTVGVSMVMVVMVTGAGLDIKQGRLGAVARGAGRDYVETESDRLPTARSCIGECLSLSR
jgi:hypothetical protein